MARPPALATRSSSVVVEKAMVVGGMLGGVIAADGHVIGTIRRHEWVAWSAPLDRSPSRPGVTASMRAHA